jgi:transposase
LRKEIVRFLNNGVLEEYYSSEWPSLFPSFAIPKKNGTIRIVTDFRKLNFLFKHRILPISYSKDWESVHDPFNGRVFLCFSIELKYGILSHQTR